jgi:hypothetical protein
MSASLPHPLGCQGVADQIKQPAKESNTVLSPETELGGVRSEGVRNRAGVVVGAADSVGDDLRDRLGILTVGEQISRDARRPGDG